MPPAVTINTPRYYLVLVAEKNLEVTLRAISRMSGKLFNWFETKDVQGPKVQMSELGWWFGFIVCDITLRLSCGFLVSLAHAVRMA